MKPTEPSTDALPDKDIAAIQSTLQSLVRAQLAGDWDAAARFCTEDHVAMPPFRPALEGRAAWLEWVGSFDMSFADMRAEALAIDGRGDLAFLRGRYSEAFTPQGGSETVQRTGKFLWILRKQPDGSWLVALAIGNPDQPPAGYQTPGSSR